MMVERTPSYNIAASLLPHPANGICFVGYCDPVTPGGQLIHSKDEESFFFDALDYNSPIRASIDRFDLSGHADRHELIEYAAATDARIIVLTHGDNDAREWFKDQLSERMKNSAILDPEPLIAYDI
jgi:Cft2 family RNA processing exonuclease